MSSSKIRPKSALLAYGVGLVMCFAFAMFTSDFHLVRRLSSVEIDNQNFFSDVLSGFFSNTTTARIDIFGQVPSARVE
jgi:hypothetical protein